MCLFKFITSWNFKSEVQVPVLAHVWMQRSTICMKKVYVMRMYHWQGGGGGLEDKFMIHLAHIGSCIQIQAGVKSLEETWCFCQQTWNSYLKLSEQIPDSPQTPEWCTWDVMSHRAGAYWAHSSKAPVQHSSKLLGKGTQLSTVHSFILPMYHCWLPAKTSTFLKMWIMNFAQLLPNKPHWDWCCIQVDANIVVPWYGHGGGGYHITA
jgi:hypothetical protein